MKVLTLSIKQKYFDEIIAGTKKHEYRDVRANNASRYFRYVLNGKEYTNSDLPSDEEEDGEVELQPVKYDAIKFLTGEYKGKRPYAIVEVVDAEINILVDEDGNDITYEYEGEEYFAAEMTYSLGRIIERSNY